MARIEANVKLAAGELQVHRYSEVAVGGIILVREDNPEYNGSAPLTREEARLVVNALKYVYEL